MTDPASNSRTGSTIVVIDDDPLQAGEICEFLNRLGYDCRVETSGFAALRHITENPPALVLLDIRMPGLNGIETARRLAHLKPRPSIILMSGHADMVAEAHRAGINVHGVLEKPIPLRLLASFVRRKFG